MAKKKRTLKLLCIKHPNLVDRVDGGNDREGGDSSERGQTRALLGKRFKRPGEDGVGLPMFMLAEIPERLHPDDTFDAEVLCDRSNGRYLLATPEWLEVRDELLGVHRRKADAAREKANDLLRTQITKGVEALAASLTTPAPPAATVTDGGDKQPKRGRQKAEQPAPSSAGENSEES